MEPINPSPGAELRSTIEELTLRNLEGAGGDSTDEQEWHDQGGHFKAGNPLKK